MTKASRTRVLAHPRSPAPVRREQLAIARASRPSLFTASLALALVPGGVDARAKPAPDPARSAGAGYRTVVRTPGRASDAQSRADRREPGFVTVVDVAGADGSRPADALPELLGRSVGVSIRSIGGLGQHSAISIRGSTAQQVGLFLDGVPLGGSLAGLLSPSDLPLDGLDRVEIHRGHVPLALGAGIGGVVHLRHDPRCRGPELRALAGFGSYGAREARAAVQRRVRGACLDLRVGHAGATGDFPTLDTRGTLLNPADDRIVRRRNNHYDRLLAQGGVHGGRGRLRAGARQIVLWKDQGVPGPAAAQSQRAALRTLLARTLASVHDDRGRHTWVAGLGVEARRYHDPGGEVGLGVDDERLLAFDAYLSPRLNVPLWTGANLHLLGEGRAEWIRVDERGVAAAGTTGDARRARQALAAGVQLDQRLGRRLRLTPSLRVDGIFSRFAAPPGAGEIDDRGRDQAHFGLSPRAAATLRLARGLDLRGSAGRYFRPPTLMELFGDRGYIVGNEGLDPERGAALDGGFVFAPPRRRRLTLRAEAAGFWVRAEDLIQWVQTGPVLQPQNLAGARLRGLELGLHLLAWRALTVDANYTLLATLNESPEASMRGRQLPGRPLHELFARAAVGRRLPGRASALEPRVFYTVEHIAGTFLDPSERYGLPPRTLHGLGGELHLAARLHLVIEIRNLLDARVARWTPPIAGARPVDVPITDFIGYPLPGRSLWASLRIDVARLRDEPPPPKPQRT